MKIEHKGKFILINGKCLIDPSKVSALELGEKTSIYGYTRYILIVVDGCPIEISENCIDDLIEVLNV